MEESIRNQSTISPISPTPSLNNHHWLKMIGVGFSIVSFCVAIALGRYYFSQREKIKLGKDGSPVITKQYFQSEETKDEPPLLIKSIGVNLDYYNPKTNRDGDFLFTKQKLQFDMLFMGYGFVIPANSTSSGQDKTNPQPTFILPLGTPVRSLVDGVVVNMPTLWSNDISIQVSANGKMEKWIYEVEHVINPTVKVGDTVKAGQIIAEVSRFDKGTPEGFGAVEIGILKGGNPPQHICPFAYLDPSIKDDMLAKIKALYVSWETYRGNTSLYNEEQVPGCLTLNPIEG